MSIEESLNLVRHRNAIRLNIAQARKTGDTARVMHLSEVLKDEEEFQAELDAKYAEENPWVSIARLKKEAQRADST